MQQRAERLDVQRMPYLVSAVLVAVGLVFGRPDSGLAQADPVRAILFFSPTCPHCHQVINQDLPVIFERFGGPARVWVDQSVSTEERAFYLVTNGQLEVLLIDASRPAGGMLYDRASELFGIPRERMGVPRLIIDDSVLVGSLEIPTQFPQLIRAATEAGGQDWPVIEGLVAQIPPLPATVVHAEPDSTPAGTAAADTSDAGESARAPADTDEASAADEGDPADHAEPAADRIDSSAPASAPGPDETAVDSAASASASTVVEASLDVIPREEGTMSSRFSRDPVGNGLSVLVLAAMLLSVFVVSARAPSWQGRETVSILVPALAALGIVVAGYLSFIETSGALAVCGPVGDCNAVQQSPYARVLGIPVGLLGLAGYVAIIAAWLLGRGSGRAAAWGTFAQFVMVFVGVVFSIYLTFLEPFVIGATCLWCLSSAVIITAMLWLVAGPGSLAWDRLRPAGREGAGSGNPERPAGR
jgi:uncharacterized membrane protein